MPFYVEIIRMQIAKAEERALTADGDKLLQYVERNGPESRAPFLACLHCVYCGGLNLDQTVNIKKCLSLFKFNSKFITTK